MTERARVCLVGPIHPYRGGIAHFTALLAREFAVDCDVFVASFSRLYPSIFFPGTTQFDANGEAPAVESRRVVDSINPLSFLKAARAIRRFRPDLVVFQWWHPFFAPAYSSIHFILRRMMKVPVVFLCHNVLPHESSPVDRLLVRWAFAGVERFLVQSSEDRDRLLGFKPRAAVQVQPHPIYDVFKRGRYTREHARRDLEVEGNVMLFFGLIRPYKGLHVLLDAFATCQDRTQTTLVIVGEFYEDDAPYRKHIEDLGIGNHIRLIDRYVPDADVEKYFLASDVVVLPYLSATQSGIVQIAYAFDKPVIVTRVGGLPDVVDDGVTGYVVPAGDPVALSDAMVRFFDDPSATAMPGRIAAAKERFSWRRCREAIEELAVPEPRN